MKINYNFNSKSGRHRRPAFFSTSFILISISFHDDMFEGDEDRPGELPEGITQTI